MERECRILVVDDELDLCEILKFNLKNVGYEVETACSAEEALEKMDGVTVNKVSHEEKCAVITLSKEIADEEFKKVVEETGYQLTGLE